MDKKVLVLVGGISRSSINKKLFHATRPLLEKDVEVLEFSIEVLPFYSQDLEGELPSVVQDLKKNIENSDGIMIFTPEYNRSIPGVLKNAIDWASRPYGKSSWTDKKVAILGLTPGATGTLAAQQNLRLVLSAVGAHTMTHPEMYLTHDRVLGESGDFASDKAKEHIQKFLNQFKSFIG